MLRQSQALLRLTESVNESLQRLRTDYVDVYQIHDVEFGTNEQIESDRYLILNLLNQWFRRVLPRREKGAWWPSRSSKPLSVC